MVKISQDHFKHFSFFGHIEFPPTHTHTHPGHLNMAHNLVMLACSMFKLTWSSGLVVPTCKCVWAM